MIWAGNPFAEVHENDYGISAEACATLALAFEQRTANLIAAAQIADDETADRLWVDHITPRLGLDGGDDDD